jgi:hypothetical protein
MLYRPNSEGAGKAEDYTIEYSRRHPGRSIEMISVDSPEGVEKARIYGITNYPAILAVSDDGGLLQVWQDEHLPLMNEIDFYQQA